MRKPVRVMPQWKRVARPYEGGELVLMVHPITGKETVLHSVMGESRIVMWNNTISRMVQEMRTEV